eukprot:scaffold5036_cov117-Isochrysis_galbana.AAC.9
MSGYPTAPSVGRAAHPTGAHTIGAQPAGADLGCRPGAPRRLPRVHREHQRREWRANVVCQCAQRHSPLMRHLPLPLDERLAEREHLLVGPPNPPLEQWPIRDDVVDEERQQVARRREHRLYLQSALADPAQVALQVADREGDDDAE